MGNQRIKVTADGTLEIHAVRPADVGDYTCALNSHGGNDTRTAKLNVVELPFSPTLVQAARVDHRSVNVSWAHAFDGNSVILKYIIQRREVPEIGRCFRVSLKSGQSYVSIFEFLNILMSGFFFRSYSRSSATLGDGTQ